MFVWLALCCMGCAGASNWDGARGRPRVISGLDETNNEYPYVVALARKIAKNVPMLARICTGSLITEEWVLTAGHCLPNEQNNEDTGLRVIYGDMTISANNTTTYSKVLLSYINHAYRPYHYQNDIGLLLVEKVPLRVFGRISAVDYQSLLGRAARYVGCGWTYHPSMNIKEAIKIAAKDETRPRQIGDALIAPCDKDKLKLLKGPLLCLRSKCTNRNQTLFSGDSGGPLIVDGKIVGVACCIILNKKGPAGIDKFMYTPVGPYLEWVHGIISTTNKLRSITTRRSIQMQ